MIYTFYSYKGGVGRSMAMANVAEWLYHRGLRVVMIDWDLEAPGLENFFYRSEEELEHVRSQLGLIDILTAYKKRHFSRLPPLSTDENASADSATVALFQEHLPPISYALWPIRGANETPDGTDGTLLLLPAGWRSGDRFAAYAQAVQNFNWSEFYSLYHGEAYFEWLRAELLGSGLADVVLIDSRTGVTEVGGICSRQLADVVVAFCVPNIQNLRGIEIMVKSFMRPELRRARKERQLDVAVVPTRVEASEDDAVQEFESEFRDAALDQFTPEAFKQFGVTFWDLRLPYVAKYAYSESLAVKGRGEPEDELAAAYRNLAICLAQLAPEDSRVRMLLAEDFRQLEQQPPQSAVITLPESAGIAAGDAAIDEEATAVASVYYPRMLKESTAIKRSRQHPPLMAPKVPTPFVRHAELERVVEELVKRRHDEPGAPVVTLHGMPGSGKSVLAAAVCHDQRIRKAFPDGILWITLGAEPGNLTGQVEEVIATLTGQQPGITSIEVATALLAEVIGERAVLLVIDDVWSAADLKPFLRGGPRCARLITTRDSATLPPGCATINVDAMEPQEALELLSANLPEGHKQELRTVAAHLVEKALPLAVPLVLELVNGVLRQRGSEGRWAETLSRVHGFLNRTPEQREPSALEAGSAVESFLATTQVLGASMEMLNEAERARYAELSVFAEDATIPLSVVKSLWSVTGGLDGFETEELVVRLAEMSLFQFDPETGEVQLHPVLRGHLLEQQGSNMRTLHRQLLDACRPALSTGWADLPEEEEYLWDNLAYHLVEAGLVDELIATVTDARYLSLKAFKRGALAAEQDLLTANIHKSRDHVVTTLRSSFVNTAHLLNQGDTWRDVAGTLHSRIAHQPGLAAIASEAEANLPRPFITARHSLPDLPDPSLSRTLLGHQDRVRCCAISDDGSVIVSASADSTVRLWDTLRGIELATFTGHKAPLRSCAISGDGTMIVSASEDGEIKVWDRTSSSEPFTLTGHEAPVSSCGISSDKQRIVAAYEDGKLLLWETATGGGPREFVGHTVGIRGCAISADSSVVISASLDGTLKAWNTVTGEVINTLHGHSAGVRDCAITADGARAVSASRDFTLKVWDVHGGIPTSTLEGHNAGVNGCAISSDGTVVVSAGRDGTLKVWDADTGKEVKTLRGHSDWVKDCAISADGVVIVSASDDRTLKIWNSRREVFRPRISQHDAEMKGLSVSANGALAACASDDKTLTLWDVRTGSLLRSLEGHSAPVLDCAIDPAEPVVVSASKDTTLKVWNMDTYDLRLTLYGHAAAVRSCAVSSDRRIIVSGSADRTLKLWDLDSGKLLHTLVGHQGSILACAISPEASWVVSSSHDHTLRLWDISNDTDFRRLSGHAGWVLDCAISPDGSLIASASADHTLKLWDVASGAERLTLRGHRAGIFGCAFSPDGSRLVSAAGDHTMRVWDTIEGSCLASLHVDGRLNACAWSSGDEITAVGSRGVYFLRLVPDEQEGAA